MISNLDIQGFETGVRLHAWINGTTLTSNVVAHSRSWGVRVGISGPEPGVTQVKNVLINQSQIFRNGEGDGQTGGIVLAMTDGVTVTNNAIGALAAETQRYGIYVSNRATNVIVIPNTFGAVAPGGLPIFFQP